MTLLAPRFIDATFGATYAAAALPLQVLIWSIPLLWMRNVFQAALIAAGREDRVLHMTAAVAALALVLNLILVPLLGAVGAAVTTVVAELARLAAGRRYVLEEGFSPLDLVPLWRPPVAALVMAAAVLATTSLVAALLVGLVVYVVTLTVLHGRSAFRIRVA
jgi:O-antigen/teichoic acid export membrane protein